MAREVFLSSLTSGRCFTVKQDDTQAPDESEKEKVSYGRTMMARGKAFKVLSHQGEDALIESAAGEQSTLPLKTLVVEIPRQGFDRLVEQA